MDVEVSDSDIDKKIDDLVKQYYKGDKTQVPDALKDQGVAQEQLRQEVAMQLSRRASSTRSPPGRREGHRQGAARLLRQEQVAVRDARDAHRRATSS